MSGASAIEWTDKTWNPVTGCSKVSEGCRNCYAEAISLRFKRSVGPWNAVNAAANVVLHPERLADPLKWKTPARIFVNSMSDLFHELVPVEFITEVINVMIAAPQHTFQVLTKRPERMQELLGNLAHNSKMLGVPLWPLPNVWIGTSVEDQRAADLRIPHLLNTPAAVRFLSCEPLLGPLQLGQWQPEGVHVDWLRGFDGSDPAIPGVDWVIAGGESGPKARPMHPDWARSLRDQCLAASVPFFFKQWGEWAPTVIRPGGGLGGDLRRGHTQHLHAPGNPEGHFRRGDAYVSRVGKHNAGRELDGRTWDEFPSPALAEVRR